MAQVFHPSFNTLSRLSLLGALVVPALLIVAGSAITRSSYNTKAGIPLEQPVPFSHEHHSVELGIDCRYCHTSVEKSAYSNVPPTHTCMSCHSQIWTNSPLLEPVRQSYATNTPLRWTQLNKVPDFVYFPHNAHVNKGINCNECHGPIQKMMLTYKAKPFFMYWCLDCHRNPEKHIRPREEVFNLYWKYQRGLVSTSPEPSATEMSSEELKLANGVDYTRSGDLL